MTARIYRPTRTAMQSGQAKDKWLLEFEPEPEPKPELVTDSAPEPPPAPEFQPEAEFQPIPATTEPVIPRTLSEAEGDEGSAVACPPALQNEAPGSPTLTPTIPQPNQIQTLNASVEPNPIVSHTYKNSKKQPSSFHTHAEIRGRG